MATLACFGRDRVAKYDLQPVAYGTVDELSAQLGLARTAVKHPISNGILLEVQRDLYTAMADLACSAAEAAQKSGVRILQSRIGWLEGITDEVGGMVQIPPAFIIPGDSYTARCWMWLAPSAAAPSVTWPGCTIRPCSAILLSCATSTASLPCSPRCPGWRTMQPASSSSPWPSGRSGRNA